LSLIREEIMGSNIAMKRAAKANRRKAIVAEKRKLELLAGTLTEKVRRAASAPIRHCLVPDALLEIGLGTVMLARGATADHLTLGAFLVDTFGLGIKDVMFRSISRPDFESYVAMTEADQRLMQVEPSYARKLLRDVAAWAASIGVAPHRDFAAVERLFGDVSADACDVTFQFGRSTLLHRRVEQLKARFEEEESKLGAPL
jgi:hypothetical protein